MSTPTSIRLVSAAAVASALLYAGVALAWSGPPAAPPSCPGGSVGCDAPLSGSAATSTKSGPIILLGNGRLGVGTSTPRSGVDVYNNSINANGGYAQNNFLMLYGNGTNVQVGVGALSSLSSGAFNVALGYSAGTNLTTGSDSVAVGYASGGGGSAASVTGSGNTSVGSGAGNKMTTATENSFLGRQAGLSATTAAYNTVLGSYAGQNLTLGTYNTAIGFQSGLNLGGSTENTFLGFANGAANTVTGNYNTVLGSGAGNKVSSGTGNTLVGRYAGLSLTTGSYNTIVGYDSSGGSSGVTNTQSGNVLVGMYAGYNHASIPLGSNNIVIGNGVLLPYGTAAANSSLLNIGNIIYGSGIYSNTAGGLSNTPPAGGKVGVMNNAPAYTLDVGLNNANFSGVVAVFRSVSGSCAITPATSGSGIACSSDERLKKDIEALSPQSELEKIMQLRPVSFIWKGDGSAGTGFVAQEVQKVFPELVKPLNDGYLTLNYTGLATPLVGAVQELTKKVEDQQRQIDELRAEIAALKAAR
jgi:hypothetical protein